MNSTRLKMPKFGLLLGVLLFIACHTQVFADDNTNSSLLSLKENSLSLRNTQSALESWREAQKEGNSESVGVPPQQLLKVNPLNLSASVAGIQFFRYYDARLKALSREKVALEKAANTFAELANSKSVAPEALDAFFEVNPPTNRDGRTQKDLMMGKLLPLSIYGRSVDAIGTEIFAFAEQPLIPISKTGRPEQDLTADRYLEMKLYDLAARDYLETIYGSFAPPRIRSWYWESWLSQITAPLWLKTAQCEWQMGRADTAANYIAKAIVFGSDATKDEALKVLEEWKTNGLPDKPPAPQPDAEKLKQIARQYAQMNMHPRAIELMKEFAPVIGPEAATLQQQYEAQWLELVARYCTGTMPGQCILFGQDVSRPENRLKVQIPPPLRPQALEQAAATVRALNDQTPAKAPISVR